MKLENIEELLYVVDMVNGFVTKGALKDVYIKHIIPNIEKWIQYHKQDRKRKIAFIKDSHTRSSQELKTFKEHCLKNTPESEMVKELLCYEKEALIYEKNSRSAIFAPHFMDDLKQMNNLKKIIITGCCTDLCVLNLALPLKNYMDENNRDIDIIVPTDAVETFNAPNHEREEFNQMAFKLMAQEGIKLERTLGE